LIQATPALNPSPTTSTATTTIWPTTATSSMKTPAEISASPNSRRRDTCCTICGPRHIPSPSPRKTAPNSTPNPGSPAPRSVTNTRPRPITTPPAPNAPTIPITSPRTSGVRVTYDQPSMIVRQTPACSATGTADPRGIPRIPRNTTPPPTNAAATAYRLGSTVRIANGSSRPSTVLVANVRTTNKMAPGSADP